MMERAWKAVLWMLGLDDEDEPGGAQGVDEGWLDNSGVQQADRQRQYRERVASHHETHVCTERGKKKRKQRVKLVPRRRQEQVYELKERPTHKRLSGRRRNPNPRGSQGTETKGRSSMFGLDQRSETSIPESKPDGKTISYELYSMIRTSHWVTLVCHRCIETSTNPAGGVKITTPPSHACSKNTLMLQQRSNGLFFKMRSTPANFDPCAGLCQSEKNGFCADKVSCSYPHSHAEKAVWTKLLEKPNGLHDLINDLRTSRLGVQALIDRFCEENEGGFQLVCKECLKSKQSENWVKQRHKPLCRNGHRWEGKLVFEQNIDGERKYTSVIGSDDLEESPLSQRMRDLIRVCKDDGYKQADIVKMHILLKARIKKAVAFQTAVIGDSCEWSEDETVDKSKKVLIDIYELQDFFSEKELESGVSDKDDNVSQREGDRPAAHNLYYVIKSKEQRESDRGNYKECAIHLDGAHGAVCKPLIREKSEGDIIVRGRRNCGATFEGDHVIVEIMKQRILDTEDNVIRGRVVNVMKRNTPAYGKYFLCTVDNYQSNLMKPLCGSVPKIHVLDENIREHPDRFAKVVVHNEHLRPIHTEKLNAETRTDYIFVVKLLRWSPSYMYPLGYVCKIAKAARSIEESQQVLNILHGVQVKHHPESTMEACKVSDRQILKNLAQRTDLRNQVTFTIDPPGCMDIDDALSIRKLDSEIYEVGVHIADVDEFVGKGSVLDKDAFRRGTTFYPSSSEPYHMLPRHLSQNICSLLPDKDRLTVSVILTLKKDGSLIGEPDIKQTVIRSRQKLTYKEVQQVLKGAKQLKNKEIQDDLHTLKSLAQTVRSNRLGLSQHWVDDKNLNDILNADAHHLVEEFMILCNQQIANYLLGKGWQCIPLRVQQQPSEPDFEQLRDSGWSSLHRCSFFFQRFMDLLDSQDSNTIKEIPVLTNTLDEMVKATDDGDMDRVKTLFTLEGLHPKHRLAMLAWFQIQEPAIYLCLGCSQREWNGHFSLQSEAYTHFTSPIRRFIDIVIHRQVKAALSGKDPPYTCESLAIICTKLNTKTRLAKKYSTASLLLDVTQSLADKPAFLPGIVSHLHDGLVEFDFQKLDHLRNKIGSVRYSSLGICSKPNCPDANAVKVKWQRRIYDTLEFHPQGRVDASLGESLSLQTSAQSYRIPFDIWEKMFEAIKEGQVENLQNYCKRDLRELKIAQQSTNQREVTSEMANGVDIVKHNCEFDLTLKQGDVLPVQVGAESQFGYMQPKITLLGLTKQFDLCIQHTVNPVQSFEEIASMPSRKGNARYRNLQQYQDIWIPILCMEAVTATIADRESIVANNVPVKLYAKPGFPCSGYIELSFNFCEKRDMLVVRSNRNNEDSFDTPDYLCLRCAYEVANQVPQKREIWVAHAKIREGSLLMKKGQKYCKLEFEVHHSDAEPPQSILGRAVAGISWTVEFLYMPLPSRRMLDAVFNLPSASFLLQSIALGGYQPKTIIPPASWEHPHNLNIITSTGQVQSRLAIPRNNEMQRKAISAALHQDVTLIQGPPGTGKTMTGVKIVYWFTVRNKSLAQKGQVMYCGPSNSAVDVAARTMQLRLGEKCPKILRVYSEMLENIAFPIPRDTYMGKSTTKFAEKWDSETLKDISLHHLIRKSSNPYSSGIKIYDELFRNNLDKPEKITDKQIENYKALVNKASKLELKEAEVILCTCSVSASGRITDKETCNIKQCIVDECGMCMEPEVLIPLVPHKPDQIVLIGDHKQLQPIVKNDIARTLGLEISIFERYHARAIMLTVQYRMHPEICRFPSKHFYEGKLETPLSYSWTSSFINIWPKQHQPIVFCHIEGAERVLTVTTAEGNEQSRMNDAEREHAVRIFAELVNNHHVNKRHIAVLTQYKAQCTEITKSLKGVGFEGANVSTVVASQGGEWDYVILSTVRSLPDYEIDPKPSIGWIKRNMGFITDHHQINVALTRAKKGLIILGNQKLLECNKMWRDLIGDYKQRGALLDASQFPMRTLQFSRSKRHHRY